MFKTRSLESLIEKIFDETMIGDAMEPEDLQLMLSRVEDDVKAMSESDVRALYGKYEVAQRATKKSESSENKDSEDDDEEPPIDEGMDEEDKVYLDRVMKIIEEPNAFLIEDEIDFMIHRDVCVLCYKHFITNRVKEHKFLTMEIMEMILKRNGDLYEGLNSTECKKVDRLIRPLEGERVLNAMSPFNFFVAHFKCTPREYFDRLNAKKAKARKDRATGGRIAKKARKGPKAPVAAAYEYVVDDLASERMC